jgi:co-chaperonin GroES (HSP10)
MKPLGNNVIVKRAEKNLTTGSGIILQRSDEADYGVVVNIGPDVVDVSISDKVLLDWNKALQIDKENYKISIDSIIAIIE